MTLAIQVLVLVALAIYAKAGAVALHRPVSDFFAAGQSIPAMVNGMATAASFIAVLAFAGLTGGLSQDWEGWTAVLIGGGVGVFFICLLFLAYLSASHVPRLLLPLFFWRALRGAAIAPVRRGRLFLVLVPRAGDCDLRCSHSRGANLPHRRTDGISRRRGDGPVVYDHRGHALGKP